MTVLSATSRLQFHVGFTLAQATDVVPYLASLGISHVYASPLSTAVKGSTHGYDVTDANRINPELGGRPALDALVAACRQHEMGLILDIVPNHMASAAPDNAWFDDVLYQGRSSPYANYFDIDWDSKQTELNNKLLLPILAEPYAAALESGNLKLHFDRPAARFSLLYFDRHIPLAAQSLPFILHQASASDDVSSMAGAGQLDSNAQALIEKAFDTATPAGRETMHQLLEMQHYRLAFWQNAADEINWRRFFEISDLIGVKVERKEVFEATHALVFELYREGLIDGVRVDHVDGLAAPEQYCRRLRQRFNELRAERPSHLRDQAPVIWLEKIVAEGEELDLEWQADGTTGYEFMNDVLRVLIDPQGEAPLTQFWVTASNDQATFDEYETRAREQILGEHLAGEFERLCVKITELSNLRVETRDVTGVVIRRVLFALLVGFRVYRVYVLPGVAKPSDVEVLLAAADRARETLRPADHPALEVVLNWLTGHSEDELQESLLRNILARFEQLSAPLAAKAVEDTAFYRYGRLLALNEVGGSPARFCLSAEEFHERMQRRVQTYPLALSPLATHDHKRGADSRARLAVLSERPEILATLIREIVLRLEQLTQNDEIRISPIDLLMLLQSVLGAWPLTLDVEDQDGLKHYEERLAGWQQKAIREAKLRSNWLLPDVDYETAAKRVLHHLLADEQLRRPIYQAVQEIAPSGALNSLTQVMLQCTAPGIPDLYQGSELWDFSLVDPDNRRPVDFTARTAGFDPTKRGDELLVHWRDGRIKQWLVAKLFAWRKEHAMLAASGDYLPLSTKQESQRLLAYGRRTANDAAIVLVPRLVSTFVDTSMLRPDPEAFTGLSVTLPAPPFGSCWIDVLTRLKYQAGKALPVAEFFDELPVALLQPDD